MIRNYALVHPYFSLSVACRQLCPTFSGNLVCIGLVDGHMHTIFCIFMKEMACYHADLITFCNRYPLWCGFNA